MRYHRVMIKILIALFVIGAVAGSVLACTAKPGQQTQAVVDLAPAEAHKLLAEAPKMQFIDVREVEEYRAGYPAGARNLPLSEIETWAPKLDKAGAYVMTCRSGRRSAQAASRLQELGVTEVKNLEGGILAWEKAGLPIAKP